MTRKEILLIQFMEECAEVQQNASKCLRFGTEEIHHSAIVSNAELVTSEFNDLLGVFTMLVEEGVLPNYDPEKILKKKEKVEYYMKHSLGL